MNWLLHTRDGKCFAHSAIWNDPANDVSRKKMAEVLSAAAQLLTEPVKKD
jgi:hypothetical protein